MRELQVQDDVIFCQINTARWIIKYKNENEEYKIHLSQKVSRKFESIILDSMLEFFKDFPEHGKRYFEVYRHFLSGKIEENKQSVIFRKLFKLIFDDLNKWLDTHPDITDIKIPEGLRNDKSEILGPEVLSNITRYSWKIKFLVLFKYNKLIETFDPDDIIRKEICQIHLIDTGLDETLLNIVKGKIISTINSRVEIWKYLEYSIRKSHELYISQLYDYTVTYIILFMRNAYNPIGYIGGFIDNQIVYVFNDIYNSEVIYHDLEEKHLKYKSLEYQRIIDDTSNTMRKSVYNFYSQTVVTKFENSFKSNTQINEMIVLPVLSKLIFPDDVNPRSYYSFNVSIYNLYLSILLSSPLFKFTHIPKLITSNVAKSTRVNLRKNALEVDVINSIYEMDLPGLSILKEGDELSSLLSEIAGYLYTNILMNVQFSFKLTTFVQEYATLLSILSDSEKVKKIKNALIQINYEFKQKDPVEEKLKIKRNIDG